MKLIVIIKGSKYDFTNFQNLHPGGGLVFNLLNDGDDATNLFESYHSMSIINSGLLNTLEVSIAYSGFRRISFLPLN